MSETIREILRRKAVAVHFEQSIGLMGATTLGIGALMGAGIYVLIGLAAGEAGPGVFLAYLLCGILALPSALTFGELARRLPVTGGGYVYAYQGLGSLGGFITGWVLVCGSVLACAMYALGFSYYFASLLGIELTGYALRIVCALPIGLLTLANTRGTEGGDKIQKLFTWGNLVLLTVLVIVGATQAEPRNLTPLLPNGLSGLTGAIAIIYISFFGYQLIANNAEEIVAPRKTIPKAMMLSLAVSLALYVAIALIGVMVIPWDRLAASRSPLVDVAARSLAFGASVIAVGGVLASAAALNGTLLSQGRQIYAMGKDKFLPSVLGRVNEVRKTPVAALWAGGLASALFAIFADLEFIAKTANFCFLICLCAVSLALREVYKTAPSGEISWWKRVLPAATFLTNLLLLLTIDWVSVVFGAQLVGIGFLIYFFYSRRREVRSRTGMSVVLVDGKEPVVRLGTRVLVPMSNPETQEAIFSIAASLFGRQRGEIVALSVITAPQQVDFYSALEDATSSVEVLDRSTKAARPQRVRLRPVVRVSRSLSQGIIHAAEEEACRLIVMGYSGETAEREDNAMEAVLDGALCDTVFFKLKGAFPPQRIGVALRGRSNMGLMVHLAGALADQFGGKITFLSVLPPGYSAEEKGQTDRIIAEAIQKHVGRALYTTELATSDNPRELIIERSAEFDLLIVGTTRVGMLERAVLGPFATQVTSRARCSVALVRVVPQVQKAFWHLAPR